MSVNIVLGLAAASKPSLVFVADRIGGSSEGNRVVIARRIVERLEAGCSKRGKG